MKSAVGETIRMAVNTTYPGAGDDSQFSYSLHSICYCPFLLCSTNTSGPLNLFITIKKFRYDYKLYIKLKKERTDIYL